MLNGHKKLVAGAAGLAAICSVLSFIGGTYNGWTQRVEASVTDRRMLNAHDETLKTIVPKVETCHGVNERQTWEIDLAKRDRVEVRQELRALAEQVNRTNAIVQAYVKERMTRGEVPR